MIKYKYFNEDRRLIQAYSDENKYLHDYAESPYEYYEIINWGYIDENGIGHFDNGHIITESSKEIPYSPYPESQE